MSNYTHQKLRLGAAGVRRLIGGGAWPLTSLEPP